LGSLCLPAYQTGSTSLSSYYDTDSCLLNEIDSISEFVVTKLGALSIGVEMSPQHIWTNVFESALQLSNEVNVHQTKANLGVFLGQPTGSLSGSEQLYPHHVLNAYERTAEGNEDQLKLGGNYTVYSASFNTIAGVQLYDLQAAASGTTGNKRIQAVELWHFEPFGAMRWYPANEYTTSVMVFGQGGSFTAEQAYYLLPIWQDVARVQQFKFSYKFRRSLYGYDIQNNIVRIYPCPTGNCSMYFSYRVLPDPLNPDHATEDPTIRGVSNMSNIPYGIISYCKLNAQARHWIREYSLALSKIDLGTIRSKYSTIPIPNADVTLDGPELIAEGKELRENLLEKLREILDNTLPAKLAEQEATLQEQNNKVMRYSPMFIYRG
jgi:hypothetical protein